MAHAVEVTISTGNKVSVNYQSREVGVSITYQLEREEGENVLAVVTEKSVEVAAAHALAWQELRESKKPCATEAATSSATPNGAKPAPEGSEEVTPIATTAQISAICALLPTDWSGEALQGQLSIRYNCNRLEQLSARQAASLLLELQRTRREAIQNRVHPNGK